MKPNEFWELTWYDWGIYAVSLIRRQQKQQREDELKMELTGQMMALLANINRDSKKRPAPFTRQDFFKLSYDTQLKPEDVDSKELFQEVARRFGGTIKKKDGGDK